MAHVAELRPTTLAPAEEDELQRLERLAVLMDSAFRLPGTNIRLGLDTIVGLIPGVGDTLTLLPGAYIIHAAWKKGVPSHTLGRMAWNSGVDWIVGSIPLIGDIFDIGYKSKLKNVRILRETLEARA